MDVVAIITLLVTTVGVVIGGIAAYHTWDGNRSQRCPNRSDRRGRCCGSWKHRD
nr:MAG TPA: hypothetical protein [Caudoviricetes sp.]